MSAPKYSAEFTEQVVPRDRSTVPAGGRGREALRAGPADRGQLGREMAHRAPRTQGRGFLERGERRRPRRLKAEPPRGPDGSRAPRKKRRPSSAPGVPVSTMDGFIRSEEGNYPVRSMCRWVKVSRSGCYAWRDRPGSATARRRQDLTVIGARFFDESEQTYGYRRIRAEFARHGVRAGALEHPEDHGRQRHDSLSTQEEGPSPGPSRGPPKPAGQAPQECHRRRAGSDMGR